MVFTTIQPADTALMMQKWRGNERWHFSRRICVAKVTIRYGEKAGKLAFLTVWRYWLTWVKQTLVRGILRNKIK